MISPNVSEKFNQWLVDHQMKVNFLTDRIFEYLGQHYLIIENKYFVNNECVTEEEYLQSKDKTKYCKIMEVQAGKFELDISEEQDWVELDRYNETHEQQLEIDDLHVIFQFGTRWFHADSAEFEYFQEFSNLDGGFNNESGVVFPYLGIHGAYDLYNGSGSYSSWVSKAKYLGVKTLGICEDNTLAGTLAFQGACEKKGIKSIIGETITVLSPARGKYQVKLYVINDEGWRELLRINSVINVQNEGYIDEAILLKNKSENLVCVVNPELEIERCILAYKKAFKHLYYQIDFVVWDSQSRDEAWLLSMKTYFENFMKKVPPILLCDTYYLDACDAHIRKSLNTIGRAGFKSQSKDQYFKSYDNILAQAKKLFLPKDEGRMQAILEQALDSLYVLEQKIEFKIPTGYFRLPQYEMTEEEKAKYADNEELFWDLISIGLKERIIDKGIDTDIYMERIEKEVEVIEKGGYISYFLALADLINFCKKQDIWVGVGRGSAAGCLISYLLGIVNLDPIHYNLLFERFLNEGRLGKSLPDIDTDFQGERRDEVKRYLEERYGIEYVTSIGTYGTFKAKAGIKALARELGVDHQKTNFVTSDISPEASFEEIFYATATRAHVKEYVQKYWKVIDKLPLILDQPNNASMHAAGVVIVPKELGSIYEQIPVKKIDGVLVSEWEGEHIDKAGFLKMDILGIKQLDKFAAMSKLIEQLYGERIVLNDINLDESGVYYYFQEGFTEDVFQFGATGLKAYCKKLKPDDIEDLIATVALYRPGPIETGMHNKYINVKNGIDELVYDRGTEEITAPTYGQIIYQEQIMQVFTHVGGFSLVEADDMRKAISKTTISREERLKSLQGFMDRFYSQGEERGYTRPQLETLWYKIEKFATYSFNRSHAACYAVTGYYCQWFKYKYPLAFWTISLQYTSKDEKIGDRLSEISKISSITIAPVDINKSTLGFAPDPKTNTIYWSIDSIKWVGEKAVKEILAEREKNGLFFSIEDFCDRLKGKAVNKRCVVNLIFAGAFDEIEKVSPEQRYKVLEKYFKFTKSKISEELEEAKYYKAHEWTLKQRELTGMGEVDFKQVANSSSVFKPQLKYYKSFGEIQASTGLEKKKVVIAGVISNIVERPYKDKVRKYYRLDLRDNDEHMSVMVWAEQVEQVKEAIKAVGNYEGRLIIFSGLVNYFNGTASVHSFKESQIQIL